MVFHFLNNEEFLSSITIEPLFKESWRSDPLQRGGTPNPRRKAEIEPNRKKMTSFLIISSQVLQYVKLS